MNTVIKTSLATLLMAATIPGVVQAEYLGLINGRSANPGNMTDLSVELGLVTGDLGEGDYQNLGARVNFRISPEVVVFGDVGISEFGDTDGTPFGLGALYFLSNQRISDKLDIAGKASYHTGEYEVGSLKGDVSSLSFEVLISGVEPITSGGVGWYGNAGLHRLTVDFGPSDSSTELGFGGGLTFPTARGEAYAGFDYIDEMTLGIGFRYYVP
jgi:hypothetical protein